MEEDNSYTESDNKLPYENQETTSLCGDKFAIDNTLIGVDRRRIADRRLINNGLPSHIHGKRTYKKSGKISFTVMYIQNEKVLHVDMLRAYNIASKRDLADTHPFVRLHLMPGKRQKQNTKYQKATKEPFFNELMVFTNMDKEELHNQRLKLRVLSYSRLRKNDLLGEVDMPLSSIDVEAKETFNLDLFLKRSEVSFLFLKMFCNCFERKKKEVDRD